MPATMDEILPLSETDEQTRARLDNMVAEYGDEILTDEEEAELYPEQGMVNADDFYANLAEFLDRNELSAIAQDVVEWTDRDEQARKDWYDREQMGIVLLGLIEDKKYVAPFQGATKATHPLLAEACTNFQARAIAELFPAGGPVKSIVLGVKDAIREAQAKRVRDFMNYQYTQVNGGFDEEDRLLMRLPMSGSCFKKQYFDPQTRVVRSDYCEAADVLVPYSASSLQTTPRYTHRMPNTPGNDIRILMDIGYYMKPDHFLAPTGEGMDNTSVHDAIDEAEGRTPTDYEDDVGYTILECSCFLNLPGFEDVDANGEPTGISLPYVVTVEKENQQVLAIRRGWHPKKDNRQRRLNMTHYKFLPGFGFYGFGFVHIIGGLAQAATGAMRSYLDAAGFANMKGGFKSRDAKLESDDPIGMGEWRDTDMTAEELAKCFFPLEYREPSKGLFEMLGYLDGVGRRYTSTTENLVGEANNSGPVGTTLALIEQGLKVFSGIHKRLHEAHTQEFKIMADLYSEFLPAKYPYQVEGEDQYVLKQDFDERVDVAPVSDPNTVTNTQRIAAGQAVIELAGSAPDIYDMRAAHRRMLMALQVENIDELIPPEQEIPPMDPVTEGVNMLTNQPVKAFPEQDHYAHILAHEIWWNQMVPDDIKPDLEPIYKAHQAEHVALWYQQQVMATLPPEMAQDPAAQNLIAQQAAGMAQLMAVENIGLAQPEQQEGDSGAKEAAEIARKDAAAAADIERKDAMAMSDIERKDAEAEAEIERAAMRDLQNAADEAKRTEAELENIEKSE